MHASEAAGDQNFSPERIANLDETTGLWIKLTARADRSFQIVNERTGKGKNYPVKNCPGLQKLCSSRKGAR